MSDARTSPRSRRARRPEADAARPGRSRAVAPVPRPPRPRPGRPARDRTGRSTSRRGAARGRGRRRRRARSVVGGDGRGADRGARAAEGDRGCPRAM